MGSKATTYLAIFLLLNLIFFTLASACGDCPNSKPKPKPKKPKCPSPATPTPKSPKPAPTPKNPKPQPSTKATCPKDTLKLSACADVLGIVKIGVRSAAVQQHCCPLIKGLVDLDAAACLCTAVKLNVANIINLRVPVDISAIVNACGAGTCPQNYRCH